MHVGSGDLHLLVCRSGYPDEGKESCVANELSFAVFGLAHCDVVLWCGGAKCSYPVVGCPVCTF